MAGPACHEHAPLACGELPSCGSWFGCDVRAVAREEIEKPRSPWHGHEFALSPPTQRFIPIRTSCCCTLALLFPAIYVRVWRGAGFFSAIFLRREGHLLSASALTARRRIRLYLVPAYFNARAGPPHRVARDPAGTAVPSALVVERITGSAGLLALPPAASGHFTIALGVFFSAVTSLPVRPRLKPASSSSHRPKRGCRAGAPRPARYPRRFGPQPG